MHGLRTPSEAFFQRHPKLLGQFKGTTEKTLVHLARCPLFMIPIIQLFFLQKTLLLIPNPNIIPKYDLGDKELGK